MGKILLIVFVTLVYVPYLAKRLKKGDRMSVVISILTVCIAVYAGLGLLLFFFQSRFVFMPRAVLQAVPSDYGMDYEDLRLTASDGVTISGWYLPVPEAEYTVLFCHGNAGNISHRFDTLAAFQEVGLNCLIFDYRGYGNSEGRPTEAGVYRDARACWAWLRQEKQIPAERIILFGRSLGGSVAARLAADLHAEGTEPAGLVLESAFTSIVDIGRRYYPFFPVRLFARFQFDTLGAVGEVGCSVLVIHSPDDEMIPYEFGQALFERAPEPKRFEQLAGTHNEGFAMDPVRYRKIWADWIESLGKNTDVPAETP